MKVNKYCWFQELIFELSSHSSHDDKSSGLSAHEICNVLVPGKLYVLKDNPINLWGFLSNNFLTYVSIKQLETYSLPFWMKPFNDVCTCFLCLKINTYQSIKNDYDVTDYIEYNLLFKNRIFTCKLERIRDKDFFDDWISI